MNEHQMMMTEAIVAQGIATLDVVEGRLEEEDMTLYSILTFPQSKSAAFASVNGL